MTAASNFHWWDISLVGDWVGVLGIMIAEAVVRYASHTTQRFGSCLDTVCNATQVGFNPELAYPYKKDTVSESSLMLEVVAVPLAVFAITQFYFARRPPQDNTRWLWRHDMHHAVLMLLYSLGMSLVVTDATKHYVGRFRPDFYAIESSDEVSQAVKNSARWSYPSGHASMSFAAMVPTTLYVLGKSQVYIRGPGCALQLSACLAFVFLALFVAVSRIHDYRHHPSDVNAGAAIGTASAFLFYFVYFPPLSDPLSYLPRTCGSRTKTSYAQLAAHASLLERGSVCGGEDTKDAPYFPQSDA
eukprot:m.597146 g.597146  ORF g.597146 m.597146 type:complete len:301 (-) comp22416_c0_seq4:2633-3535(-)